MTNTSTNTAPLPSSAQPAPVTWFEIHTADRARAEKFYGELFGWRFDHSMPDYSMIDLGADAPHAGGIADTKGESPAAAIFHVQVPDVDASCAAVTAAGGSVIVPTQATPIGLQFAYVADPDGSMFGLFSPPTE